MSSKRQSVLTSKIAPARRALFLVIMMFGLIVAATHSGIIGTARADGSPGQTLLVEPDLAAGPFAIAEAVPAASCPAQSSCHGVTMLNVTAETATTPSRGGFWRLLPGRTRAIGRRLGQDHPPPIA